MELYLLRHALAVERSATRGQDDRLRPLAPAGEEKMRRAARGMRELELSFDLILSSPYARARETAALVVRVLAHRRGPEFSDLLVPEADPKKILRHLSTLDRSRSVLLVGHEPHLGRVLAALLGLRRPACKLKKGALVRLAVEKFRPRPVAQLEWLLTSGHLARLGE